MTRRNQTLPASENIFFICLLALMMASGAVADVVLTNTGGVNPGDSFTFTISSPTGTGLAAKVTISLSTTVTNWQNGNRHPVACFPNENQNVMADGDTLTGWVFYLYCTSTPACSDATGMAGKLKDASLTRNGDNYDYAYLDSAVSTTVSWQSSSFDSTGFDGVFQVGSGDSAAVGLYPNITSAICFFATDARYDTANSYWGTVNLTSVNLSSNATMILFGGDLTSTDTSGDIGGESSLAHGVTLTAVLAVQVLSAFY